MAKHSTSRILGIACALSLSLGALVVACNDSSPAGASTLASGTGTDWVVDYHPTFHTVSYALPKNGPVSLPSGDAASAVLEFLQQYRSSFGMVDPRTEWAVKSSTTDDESFQSIRYQQMTRGVPAYPGEWLATVDPQGRLVWMAGAYIPGTASVDLSPPASSPPTDAVIADVIARNPGTVASSIQTMVAPQPVVFAGAGVSPMLAFYVKTALWQGTVDFSDYFVDAGSGAIGSRQAAQSPLYGIGYGAANYAPYNQPTAAISFPISASAPWTLDGTDVSGLRIFTANEPRTSTAQPTEITASGDPNTWTDSVTPPGADIDAQHSMSLVADAYKSLYGRNSFDGNGTPVEAIMGDVSALGLYGGLWVDKSMLPTIFPAAGVCDGVIVVSPGFAITWSGQFASVSSIQSNSTPPAGATLTYPLGASIDDTAHEFTHGVSYCTWATEFSEANEAMSDILAQFITSFIQGGAPHAAVGQGLSPDPTFFFRNLAAPHAPKTFLTPSCDSMSEYPACENGPRGQDPHAGAGIVTYAWYLMTFGGTHESNGRKVPCGIGWKASSGLWYDVEINGLPKGADMKAIANATLAGAKKRNVPLMPVACAWVAVGMLTDQDVQSQYGVTCPASDGGAPPAGTTMPSSTLVNGQTQLIVCQGQPLTSH